VLSYGGITDVYTNITEYTDSSCSTPAMKYQMALFSQYSTQPGNNDMYLPDFDYLERANFGMTLTPGSVAFANYLSSNCACGSVWQMGVTRTVDTSSFTCCGSFARPLMYYSFHQFGSTLLFTPVNSVELTAFTSSVIDTILISSTGRLVGDVCESSVQCASLNCDADTSTCRAHIGDGGGVLDPNSEQQLCWQNTCLVYWQAYIAIAAAALVILALCAGLIQCCRKKCCRNDRDDMRSSSQQMEVA